jgi:hypothetical protein
MLPLDKSNVSPVSLLIMNAKTLETPRVNELLRIDAPVLCFIVNLHEVVH